MITITQAALAFHEFQNDMMRVMTRYPAMSKEQEAAAQAANQKLRDKLQEHGLAQYIDWS